MVRRIFQKEKRSDCKIVVLAVVVNTEDLIVRSMIYEEGLEAIKAGIEKPSGTKKRDAVNIRLGKLDQKYGAIRKSFTINFTYENKEKNQKATSMTWVRNEMKIRIAKTQVMVTLKV